MDCFVFINHNYFTDYTNCDPTEIVLPNWRTEFLIPLLEADFDFQDVTLNEQLRLDADSTGALTIVYVSGKKSVRFIDLISIPDYSTDFELPSLPNDLDDFQIEASFSPQELGIPMGTNIDIPPFTLGSISKAVDLSDQFEEAEFETGLIDLDIENQFPLELDAGIIIEARNTSSGNLVLSHTTQSNIAAFGSYSMSTPISLADKLIEGQLTLEFINIASPGGNNTSVSDANFIKASVSLTNLKLKTATMKLAGFNTGIQTQELVFTIPNGALLQSIELIAGNIVVDIDEGYSLPIELNLSIPSISFQNGIFQHKLDLNQSNQVGVDLANSVIDLTNSGAAPANTLLMEVELQSAGTNEPVFIDFKKQINGKLLLSNFHPHAVFGYLGTYRSVLSDSLQIDLFDRVVSGTINFKNPIVIATIENELGVSGTMDNDETVFVRATNPKLSPGVMVDIGDILRNSKIDAALVAGETAISQIELNGKNESSFEDFISLLPSTVEYQFPFIVGTATVDYNQFVIDSSKVTSQLQMELPLDLLAKDLTITDTLDFSLDLDTTYTNIVRGVLSSKVVNVFPLEFLFQGYFVDSTHQVIDSLFEQKRLISPGEINSEGRVVNPFEIQFDVEINETRMDNLQKAHFIMPVFVVNTFGQERVKIFSDSRIRWKLNADLQVILTNTP